MKNPNCPKCDSSLVTKSGVIKDKQRFKCKTCNYNFTVEKLGKGISQYYVIKALQLYIEGVTYREIERLLGVSHVSVMNWVKKYQIKVPKGNEYHPTYKILNHKELAEFYANRDNLKGAGMIVTELGDKFMLIKWERLKH
ncbi:MAG: transposase [Flectobacillus sp.]|uniref:transposase n=1 Tax=Flectobacillus sp. TaxID=50419 RepID=UPI003B9D8317